MGALTALRAAIARLGIGLIVVAAGEAVYQFTRLMGAAGGFGKAMGALKNVALEVWERIGDGTQYVVQSVIAMGEGMKKSFLWALHDMAGQFFYFVSNIAQTINSVFGTSLTTDFGRDVLFSLYSAGDDARIAAEAASSAAAASAEAFSAPLASLAALNQTVAEGTTEALGGVSGLGQGLDQLKDKAGGAKEKLSALQNVMKSLKEELQMLQATLWMTDLDASIWEKQREAGVAAETVNGRLIDSQMRQIDGLKRLKAATDEWKDSISSAFSSFITQGGSFKNVLSDIIGKLAEMMMNKAFESLWATKGGGGFLGGAMKLLGFSNGTNFAPGGLARVNERGGEIMNLPRGTQVIPHDISKRMADNASKGGGGGHISIGFDGSMGGFTAVMRDVAGQEVSRASASIVSLSVLATQAAQKRGHR